MLYFGPERIFGWTLKFYQFRNCAPLLENSYLNQPKISIVKKLMKLYNKSYKLLNLCVKYSYLGIVVKMSFSVRARGSILKQFRSLILGCKMSVESVKWANSLRRFQIGGNFKHLKNDMSFNCLIISENWSQANTVKKLHSLNIFIFVTTYNNKLVANKTVIILNGQRYSVKTILLFTRVDCTTEPIPRGLL